MNNSDIETFLDNIQDIQFKEYNIKKSIVFLKDEILPIEFEQFDNVKKKLLEDIFSKIKDREKIFNKNSFNMVFNDRYIRVESLSSIAGSIYCCRHMPKDFIYLEKAGFSEIILQELNHERLNKGGLVFISGSPGQGKSNTAAALIHSRLEKHGGIFVTIEDPVEIPLQGKHGKGHCIQIPVINSFSDCIKSSLRAYPASQNCGLFIGELRDYDSAIAALQAAIDGRLVITTFHTKSLELAFERLFNLISSRLTKEEAGSLIAEAFKLGIHQRLLKTKDSTVQLRAQILVDTHEVYSAIKLDKIALIQDQLEKQFTKLKNQEKFKYR